MKSTDTFKILFIDDEPASLTAFKSVFRDDFDISVAASAEEGYKIMKEKNIDIVISDQRMPGITGVEFLQKIRVEFPDTIRMLITGYSDIDAVIRSINGSMVSYYFSKPYNEKDMKVILDSTIEKIKLMRENRTLITKLQTLIEELNVQKSNLEKEILMRTAAETELMEAHEKVESSSRLKSSLLLNLNHEFRTPMNSILGFSQILKESLPDDEFRRLADMINISGKRLMKTLNAIINLARYEADKKPPEIEDIDLSEMTTNLCKDFREHAIRKNIDLREDIQPGVYARFNASFAGLIITNLIDNALKFTKEGYIAVQVKHEKSDDSEYAEFSVQDTGIGIPPDFHDKIFDEFRQVSEGVGRYYEGLGIGLSLCKKLLVRLDGEISVESKEGQGSLFTIRIPAAKPAIKPQEELTHLTVQEASRKETAPDKKGVPALPVALVVEDNENNQELIEMFIQQEFRICKANDGESAVRMARDEKFDIILMDINLGTGIDGAEAMRQIRKIERYADVPVLALTGYSGFENKNKYLDAGFSAFIPKPFTRQVLLTEINKSMKNR